MLAFGPSIDTNFIRFGGGGVRDAGDPDTTWDTDDKREDTPDAAREPAQPGSNSDAAGTSVAPTMSSGRDTTDQDEPA